MRLKRHPGLVELFLGGGELLYGFGLKAVHALYEKKLLPVHTLKAPVVSVGNLTWGGTGKTPLVLQLAQGLKKKGYQVAVLTRGYGRDESKLLSQRLAPIPVLVDPDRVASGARAVREKGANLLLLDDGYQQWRLKKDVEILTIDATLPFGNGHLIPRGILREPKENVLRADLIVLTKVDGNPEGAKGLKKELEALNPDARIFFCRYRPVHLASWPSERKLALEELRSKRVCALSGIARPEPFEAAVEKLGAQVVLKIRVQDHHPYTAGEMIRILSRCRRHGVRHLVTTAKDAVRIPPLLTDALGKDLGGIEVWVLEVQMEFEPDEGELLHRIDSLLAR
ncbi:MAG: tetraacyldisaccharide 4'-kinase [Candidatus Omnitrophica bacterium]|nr:tetraacyldisaccharide 4'-kinase [Candidatus Omnitrophota bacterium]